MEYAVQTWFGTLLHVDAAGQLRHAPVERVATPLLAALAAGRLRLRLAAPAPPDALTTRLLAGTHELQGDASGFSLKLGGFLCAEPDGRLVADRAGAGAWEHFSLVPMPAPARLGRDLRPLRAFPRPPPASLIPPTIHQIFLGAGLAEQPPGIFADHAAALLALNPGYRHVFWTRSRILDAIRDWYGPDMLAIYLRINPGYRAAQADLFRYLLMYREGGVYLDLKSGASRPFAQIFPADAGYLLSHWDNAGRADKAGMHPEIAQMPQGEYQQWFIICAPGHEFLRAVILRVLENLHAYDPARCGTGRLGVLRTTGPIPYTQAIHPIRDQHPHWLFQSERDGLDFIRVQGGGLFSGAHYAARQDAVVLQD